MLEKVYQHMPSIGAAYLVVTEQCNLRCKYCYETHGDKRMTKEVARAGIDFLFRNSEGANNEIDVTFFGGEPTLEVDLIVDTMEYGYNVSKSYNKPIRFGIVTNCVTLPLKLQNVIKKYGNDNDINVQLSIDGPDMIQDQYRVFADGSGSWKQVTKTLDKWKELFDNINKGFLSVHGCFNRNTLKHLYDSYIYFREERDIKSIWHSPIAEEKWLPEDIELYKEQLLAIKEHIELRCIADGNSEELQGYAPLNRCLSNEPSERGRSCGAGDDFVSISPEGKLTPCHQIYFNVPDSSIGDVWGGVDNDRRRLFTEYDDSDFPCGEKKCENKQCFRCIAHNFDIRQNMFAIHSDTYCKMMSIDRMAQNDLREFLRRQKWVD